MMSAQNPALRHLTSQMPGCFQAADALFTPPIEAPITDALGCAEGGEAHGQVFKLAPPSGVIFDGLDDVLEAWTARAGPSRASTRGGPGQASGVCAVRVEI